jgi:DHA3 family macrolide efflux protein-like MFS transporter
MSVLDTLLLRGSDHARLLHNRAFVQLWSGQTVSIFGDALFNLAVMWVVWTEARSTLQTAIIQAVWQLPDALFAPLAGIIADRWDRKSFMVITSIVAAVVVGAVATVIAITGHLPAVVAFVAIFKLNSLTTFISPARASIMPAVVGRDLLVTASGMFNAARSIPEAAIATGSLANVTGVRLRRGLHFGCGHSALAAEVG